MDAKKIEDFIAKNKETIEQRETGFGAILELARKNPSMKLPENLCEQSIYSFVDDIRSELGIPTLVLLDDDWFAKNEIGARQPMVHLISLGSFLRDAEGAKGPETISYLRS